MLSAGDFPLPCASNSLLSPQSKPNPFSLFPLSLPSRLLRQSGTRLRIRAQRRDRSPPPKKNRTQSNSVGAPLLDIESLKQRLGLELGEFDDGDEDEDAYYDDDEDDDVLMPLERMNKWLENRPLGFGEGKVYDTGIEDQLLDEMLQSREAQSANIANLKSDPLGPDSKRDEPKKKANELVPNGVKVRVTNLPKKKNVHRDLSPAFKGVSGMISINPVVSGNKKTRDPICKGFAFVYFKSDKDAIRFVETFSKQNVLFGKIQKQIKCEMVDSKASETELLKQSTENTHAVPEVKVEVVEESQSSDYSETDDSFVGELDDTVFVEFDDHDDDDVDVSEWEDDEEDFEDDEEDLDSVTEMELNNIGRFEQRVESESLERVREPVKSLRVKDKCAKVPKRNTAAKGKEVKAPKLDIPGSARRLQVKEKAVLTDVFSKYGQKSALASKKER